MKTSIYALHDTDLLLSEQPQTETRYTLKVRDLELEEKPREKLQQHGPARLSVAELVAILLGVGTKKEEVMAMSHRILHEYGEKAIISETDPRRLADVLDIPYVKACQLVASLELGRRFYASREGKPIYLRTAEAAYQHVAAIGHTDKEQLRGLYLNSRYELIHDEVLSVGTLTANLVHPREVFKPALAKGAVAVIIAHNHPSGSLAPTEADRLVTSQLTAAGKILGIELLDHIIVTEDNFVSIAGARDE